MQRRVFPPEPLGNPLFPLLLCFIPNPKKKGAVNNGRARPKTRVGGRNSQPLSPHNTGGGVNPRPFFGWFFICCWRLAAAKRIDGGIKLLLGHSVLGHEPCTRCVECRGCAAYRITVAQAPRTRGLLRFHPPVCTKIVRYQRGSANIAV